MHTLYSWIGPTNWNYLLRIIVGAIWQTDAVCSHMMNVLFFTLWRNQADILDSGNKMPCWFPSYPLTLTKMHNVFVRAQHFVHCKPLMSLINFHLDAAIHHFFLYMFNFTSTNLRSKPTRQENGWNYTIESWPCISWSEQNYIWICNIEKLKCIDCRTCSVSCRG